MLHSDSKKLKAALTFLQHIDPSGYLCSVADPTNPSSLTDDSLKERNQRIEKMTCAMDVQQYLEYAKVTCFYLCNWSAFSLQKMLYNLLPSRPNQALLKEVSLMVNSKTGCSKGELLKFRWMPRPGRYLVILRTKRSPKLSILHLLCAGIILLGKWLTRLNATLFLEYHQQTLICLR